MGAPANLLRQLAASWHEQLLEWHERRHARRVCREVLRAYARVREREPSLEGPALYVAVIRERLQYDAASAQRLLFDAHESREDWDNPRPPLLRDVILYMIVSEYLQRGKGRRGMVIDLRRLLDTETPARL